MKTIISLTAIALGLSSGVAFADRGHDNQRPATVDHRRPNVVVRHGNWNRGNTVVVRDNNYRNWNRGNRVIVRRDYHPVVRRPIFVARPVIRARYYNYYRRPAIIVENYGPRGGYLWVAGAWAWSGAEWLWQPGHYQPDPSYVDPNAYYDDQGTYDQGTYDQGTDNGNY
jgi:hypothetical protein